MDSRCRLSQDILIISLISIAYNCIGWIMFNTGYENVIYRIMYLVLYAWAFYVLIRGEPKNAGDAENNSWLYSLRFNAGARHYFNNIK
jgi:hypothetical protein